MADSHNIFWEKKEDVKLLRDNRSHFGRIIAHSVKDSKIQKELNDTGSVRYQLSKGIFSVSDEQGKYLRKDAPSELLKKHPDVAALAYSPSKGVVNLSLTKDSQKILRESLENTQKNPSKTPEPSVSKEAPRPVQSKKNSKILER